MKEWTLFKVPDKYDIVGKPRINCEGPDLGRQNIMTVVDKKEYDKLVEVLKQIRETSKEATSDYERCNS